MQTSQACERTTRHTAFPLHDDLQHDNYEAIFSQALILNSLLMLSQKWPWDDSKMRSPLAPPLELNTRLLRKGGFPLYLSAKCKEDTVISGEPFFACEKNRSQIFFHCYLYVPKRRFHGSNHPKESRKEMRKLPSGCC